MEGIDRGRERERGGKERGKRREIINLCEVEE